MLPPRSIRRSESERDSKPCRCRLQSLDADRGSAGSAVRPVSVAARVALNQAAPSSIQDARYHVEIVRHDGDAVVFERDPVGAQRGGWESRYGKRPSSDLDSRRVGAPQLVRAALAFFAVSMPSIVNERAVSAKRQREPRHTTRAHARRRVAGRYRPNSMAIG